MTFQPMKTARLIRNAGERPLSGEALTELLRSVLAAGRPLRFRARGLSMSPFIKDGDVLTVRPLGGEAPRTGDIVAFIHPETGKAAVHRVVRGKSGLFSLKGDNSPLADGTVALEQILGTVCRVERSGKDIRLARSRGAAVIAALSRSGWLGKGLSVARRARGRRGERRPA
ncbi:MAG: S24/S26 family peptidase [Acidobacteriota bacterium]